jgi:hypothetical protein
MSLDLVQVLVGLDGARHRLTGNAGQVAGFALFLLLMMLVALVGRAARTSALDQEERERGGKHQNQRRAA